MSKATLEMREEVERIKRVSDQLCTGHAVLRDRFARRALILDIVLLIASAWLTAVAFIDPRLNQWLIPSGIDSVVWIGILGFLTFSGSLFQLKTDWKGRSEAHQRTGAMYAEVKREAGYVLASSVIIEPREFQRLAARYDMASDSGVAIPDSQFLSMKKRHLQKVAISKLLDSRPGLSPFLTKAKMFAGDNWPWRKK